MIQHALSYSVKKQLPKTLRVLNNRIMYHSVYYSYIEITFNTTNFTLLRIFLVDKIVQKIDILNPIYGLCRQIALYNRPCNGSIQQSQ